MSKEKTSRKFKFGKLVRDKIVDSIIECGGKASFRKLQDDEYIIELAKKLQEEGAEVVNAKDEEDLLKEVADVQEVIDNIIATVGVSRENLYKYQEKKNLKTGSFKKKLYVEDVECDQDYPWLQYYLDNPEKYPEIK